MPERYRDHASLQRSHVRREFKDINQNLRIRTKTVFIFILVVALHSRVSKRKAEEEFVVC